MALKLCSLTETLYAPIVSALLINQPDIRLAVDWDGWIKEVISLSEMGNAWLVIHPKLINEQIDRVLALAEEYSLRLEVVCYGREQQ